MDERRAVARPPRTTLAATTITAAGIHTHIISLAITAAPHLENSAAGRSGAT